MEQVQKHRVSTSEASPQVHRGLTRGARYTHLAQVCGGCGGVWFISPGGSQPRRIGRISTLARLEHWLFASHPETFMGGKILGRIRYYYYYYDY
jgi:hypothetical protein